MRFRPMTIETEWRDYDVVVIGSGGSGSFAAHAAAEEGASLEDELLN